MMRLDLCVLIMILVTYLPRTLPIMLFRRPLKSLWLRSFLDYVPYAVLAAMTIPAVFSSTRSLWSGVAGLLVAVGLSLKGKSLMLVALGAVTAVWLLELAMGLPFN